MTDSTVTGNIDFDNEADDIDAYEFAEWSAEQINGEHVELILQSLGFDEDSDTEYVATSIDVEATHLKAGVAKIWSLEGQEVEDNETAAPVPADQRAEMVERWGVDRANARNLFARFTLRSPDLLLSVSPHLAYAERNDPSSDKTVEVAGIPQPGTAEFATAAAESAKKYATIVEKLKDEAHKAAMPPEEYAVEIEYYDRVRSDLERIGAGE